MSETEELNPAGAAGYNESDIRLLELTRAGTTNMLAAFIDAKLTTLSEDVEGITRFGLPQSSLITAIIAVQLASARLSGTPLETSNFLRHLAAEIEENPEFGRMGHAVTAPPAIQAAIVRLWHGVINAENERRREHEAQKRAQLADLLASMGVEQPAASPQVVQ